MIHTQKNILLFLGPKNVGKILCGGNIIAFSLLFSLKILLFSVTTLPFWVASESHLLFLLTAKSLSSKSPDSSSKKTLDFV